MISRARRSSRNIRPPLKGRVLPDEEPFHGAGRRRGPASLRGDVPVLEPGARRGGFGGGGLGVIQPLSLVYVHKLEFREGLKRIRSLTAKPVGLNILTEKSLSAVYRKRMEEYLEVVARGGDPLLRHGARKPRLGRGARARGRRRRLPRRGRPPVGRERDRRGGRRAHLRQQPRRRARGAEDAESSSSRSSPTSASRSSARGASGARPSSGRCSASATPRFRWGRAS